jgi:hypothetical protein
MFACIQLCAAVHLRDNLKAHYLLGIAQRELHDLDDAITHLSKALDAAREQGDSIKDEVGRNGAQAASQAARPADV